MSYKLQPLRLQTGWKIEFNNFTEYDINIHSKEHSFELCEDLLQIYNEKSGLIIDLGWYPSGDEFGSYKLFLIKNFNWDSPLEEVVTRSKNDVINYIEKWSDYGFYEKYL